MRMNVRVGRTAVMQTLNAATRLVPLLVPVIRDMQEMVCLVLVS